jgi:putative iron-dependent peroxidase
MSGIQDVEAGPGRHAIFMVWGLPDTGKAKPVVAEICGLLEAMVRSLNNRFPGSETGAVLGFGAGAWPRLFPDRPVPPELKPFAEIRGERHTAPSTPGDLLLHLRSSSLDIAHELAMNLSLRLGEAAVPVDETHGFRYFDGRAIIGFVDGTENPQAPESSEFARISPADLPEGAGELAGGSYVLVQKYLHDLKAWEALPVEEQERAIGRRKFNDLELGGEAKPGNAHNAVTNISGEDGSELKIVRANMPFANPSKGEFGTYFIGYAGRFSTTRRMLENMFLGDPPGNTDRLLDFSRAVTGTLFYVPPGELLAALGEQG